MRKTKKISDSRMVVLRDEEFFDPIDRRLRKLGYARLETVPGSCR